LCRPGGFCSTLHPFNAEIGALALLNMAMANPECDGITVNSAASEHTVVIPRTRIAALIAKTDEAKSV
jgi:hypothetical protein